jgi:mannose-1-phosphate guanylyltransferase
MSNVNAVILCGGVGTRLWPLSREKLPKQLLPLVNSKSMLQNTITRVNSINSTHSDHGLKINKFIFICNADHSFIIQQQIAELDVELAAENNNHESIQDRSTIITEPEGRNTAPAIAISTLYTDPTDMSLVVPADHVFDDHMFMKLVSDKVLSYNPSMCLFGIRPSYPATGYGYIESSGIINKHIVRSFIEKPNEETATKYTTCLEYHLDRFSLATS